MTVTDSVGVNTRWRDGARCGRERRPALALHPRHPRLPEPGIVFRDITPLLVIPPLRAAIEPLAAPFAGPITKVVGIEDAAGSSWRPRSRSALGAGFVPVRKLGKLPWDTHASSTPSSTAATRSRYTATRSTPDDRVLIVDDLLATGGTATAACRLVVADFFEATVVGVTFLLEITAFGGLDPSWNRSAIPMGVGAFSVAKLSQSQRPTSSKRCTGRTMEVANVTPNQRRRRRRRRGVRGAAPAPVRHRLPHDRAAWVTPRTRARTPGCAGAAPTTTTVRQRRGVPRACGHPALTLDRLQSAQTAARAVRGPVPPSRSS